MKEVQASVVTNEKGEKEPVSDEEEERMYQQGLLGEASAKTLLHTIYFYKGKIFGMRSQEHRQLRLDDIKIENDKSIVYRENISITFHGGIADMKMKGKVVKDLCHGNENDSHKRCLVKIYKCYVESYKANAFYFQQINDVRFEFKKCAVGIHSLNNILPGLCGAIGTKRKTSHSLRVTCVTQLFNNNVQEMLIRSRSGHVSDALLGYEKSSKDQKQKFQIF